MLQLFKARDILKFSSIIISDFRQRIRILEIHILCG